MATHSISHFPLGSHIQTYRSAAGMTQAQLAQELVVSPETIQAWESGTSWPTLMQIPPLCSCLGVSYEQLFGVSKRAKQHRSKKYYQITFTPVLSNYVISTVRKKRHMSLEEFADKVGISVQDATLMESGKRIPRLEQIPVICKVLGIRIKKFFE